MVTSALLLHFSPLPVHFSPVAVAQELTLMSFQFANGAFGAAVQSLRDPILNFPGPLESPSTLHDAAVSQALKWWVVAAKRRLLAGRLGSSGRWENSKYYMAVSKHMNLT